MTPHARAASWMVAAAFLWSTAGLVTRWLERAESWEVAFWRSFFAALSMAGILAVTRRRQAWSVVRGAGWPGLLSGLMFCTMFTCFMLAVTRTTVANALVVNSLFPVFAGLLSAVVLGTRLPAYTWIAISVAVGGMAFMFASGLGAGLAGTLIAFGVPVAAASMTVASACTSSASCQRRSWMPSPSASSALRMRAVRAASPPSHASESWKTS
jgi:drug/metabolite transporter (DMT)-like permease